MAILIYANNTYFDPVPQEREPEDMNFSQPYDDKEVRRTNPKRYDKNTDQYTDLNEKAHDSDVVNRYSSVPSSIILYKFDKLLSNVNKHDLEELKQLMKSSTNDINEYFNERLSAMEYSQVGLVSLSSMAARDRRITIAMTRFVINYLLGSV